MHSKLHANKAVINQLLPNKRDVSTVVSVKLNNNHFISLNHRSWGYIRQTIQPVWLHQRSRCGDSPCACGVKLTLSGPASSASWPRTSPCSAACCLPGARNRGESGVILRSVCKPTGPSVFQTLSSLEKRKSRTGGRSFQSSAGPRANRSIKPEEKMSRI